MLFSVFSVGVNAALVQNEVNYDSIDNAVLSPEQVADIILDLLEPVLADVDLDIGAVGLVIKSVDTTLETVEGIGTLANVAGGDVANIKPNAVKGVRRSGGDLNVIYALLQFLADNTNANLHLEKVAYGIGQDKSDAADAKLAVGKLLWTGKIIGIDLGFNLKDMELIGQLGDIPGLLKGLIFDLLLQGSYAYPNEWETETNASIKSMSLEDMINNAIYNLLTTPQEYTRDENGNKIWDNDSVILGKIGTEGYSLQKSDLTVAGAGAKTILGLVDTILQEAYNEFATVVLNHDVKKIIMEATGADFIRITDEAEIARVSTQTGMPTTGVKNYFCNAAMWKDAASGIYYFRDYVTETTVDEATGEEIKNKVDRYFVANAANANKFFDLVNWDYLFTESTYNFDAGLAQYGSIFGQLNHLVYAILDEAILDSIKADIAAVTGKAWWTDGDNTNLIPNLINVAKWVLQYAPEEIFSKDSEFYDLEYSEIAGMNTLKELLAFIGIPLLQDGMPQLILPDNLEAANIIEQIGAIVLREFISDVTPVVNYDAQIFQAGTLDAAQRKIITGQDSEYWFNIVLNMAIDMAVIYLDNITNINLDSAKVAEYKAAGWGWEQFLDEIVDWAILYVGSGANCPLAGLDPNTLGAVRGDGAAQGLNKLTKALNTILPLGLVSNCSGSNAGTEYPLDMQVLFNKLKSLLHNVDLNELLSLFGRQNQTGNLLLSAPLDTTVVHLVIDILNLLLGAGRIAKVDTLTALTSKANLKLLVGSLIHGLNTRKVAILTPVLPIVAAFVEGWGTEQNFEAPDINICPKFVAGQNGECSIRNNINGVWRKYAGGQDNQYSLVVDSITTNNGAVTVVERDGAYTGTYTLSENQPFRLNSSLTADTMVQVTVTYHINAEDGIKLGGKNFTATRDVYVTNGNEGKKADYTNSTAAKKQIGTTSRSNIAFIDISGDAVGSIANAVETTTADFNRYNLWLLNDNNKGDVSITFTYSLGSLATLGIGAANPSVTLGRGDESNGHVVFTSTGVTADKLVPGRYEGSYSVGLPYTTTKQSGNFATGTAYLVIYLYDSKAFVELQDTVGDVRNAARIASDYYTDDMVINYTDAAGVEHEDVTVNGAAAWANYDAAYKAAYNVAYQDWDTSSVFSGYEAYEDALRDAATILDCFKKSAEDLGGDNVDAAVDALKAAKEQAEESLNSYKDYMLYRWDRYTEYANRANDVINKKDAASKTADIYSIPGTGYSYYDVNKLLTDANSPYKSFVLATREDLTAEQIKANQTNLKNAKNAYANVTSVQVADIANNVPNMAARLIVREGNENGAVKTYLQHEVNSAIAALGESAVNETYTAKSWAKYATALTNAKAALAAAESNSKVFDAKYELQLSRNELILANDGADYTEINNAIAMAEQALALEVATPGTYVAIDGTATADEWGNVVKALGLTVEDADGNDATIFGGAKAEAGKVYALNRQDRLDNAASALMLALSKLKFATAYVTPLPSAPVQKEEDATIIVDEDNTEITVNLLTVAPVSTTTIVKAQVTVNLPANAVDGDITTTASHMGTGAVVTVTGVIGGQRVPLNAYTVVVKGDVNGDSEVDAIDAAAVELAVNNHATLYGLQNLAARYTGGTNISVDDFTAIENAALGLTA